MRVRGEREGVNACEGAGGQDGVNACEGAGGQEGIKACEGPGDGIKTEPGFWASCAA